ncbi:hypothetical protein BOX15_Mlig000316g3 [Macrostomum lignano]|uniref:Uncharacterized protein n=1 Tax=Macrostomum lignano TaxID=282301 RepID=A0A267FT73_9PLAT|nr:hypothetical protein BOX15_Mlig000316g3 [Macrostomum lignano]
MTRFVEGTFRNQMFSTVGVDFCTKNLEVNGRQVSLQILDTAGQERFRFLGPSYYRGADAAMLVFDSSNRSSFDSCARWLDELRLAADRRLTIMLVANKADLPSAAVSRDEAERFVQEFGLAGFAEVSAMAAAAASVAPSSSC